MRRRTLGLLLPFLAGCHGPAANFARLDVANPAADSGWVQFRHEPGGYAFQAPRSWTLDPQDDARRVFARTGSDLNLFLRLVDLDAGRRGDLVSFAVTRLSFGDETKLRVMNLDGLGHTALKGMRLTAPDAKRERLTLPIGAAEHVWATMQKPLPDGTKQAFVSHLVVFATALRPFVLMYGYPAAKEAQYRPTLDRMVRSVRLFLPKPDGQVVIPVSAHPPETALALPAFGASGIATPPTSSADAVLPKPASSATAPPIVYPGTTQPGAPAPGPVSGDAGLPTTPTAASPGSPAGANPPVEPTPPAGTAPPASGTTGGPTPPTGGLGTAPPPSGP